MSLTPAVAESLRQALADRAPNVIGVKYGICDASAFAAVARDAMLTGWGLA